MNKYTNVEMWITYSQFWWIIKFFKADIDLTILWIMYILIKNKRVIIQ